MNDHLGAWPNAPLAYVLAEIRTEILSDIAEFQPVIAKQLRQDYPVQRKLNMARVVATGTQVVFEQAPEFAWEFATPDNRTAVNFRTNGIILHATSYTTSVEFFTRLEKILSVFVAAVPNVYINRLGLRYVDFILPQSNETPEDYINEKLNPDLGLSANGLGYMATNLASYPMQRGVLNLRYMRAHGQTNLPPDLGMLTLTPSELMKPSHVLDDQPTAIVDMDRIIEFSPVEQLEVANVQGFLTAMRDDIRHAFRDCVITEHAKKMWGAK